jgi:hypothetical protein
MYRTIAVGGGLAWNWTVYGIAAAGQAPDPGSRTSGVQGGVGNMPAARAGRLTKQDSPQTGIPGRSRKIVNASVSAWSQAQAETIHPID